MTFQIQPFGLTSNLEKVEKCVMRNQFLEIHILEYGAIIQKIVVLSENKDVVLGYDTLREYEQDTMYMGSIVGRVANRIGGGTFTINDKKYTLEKNDPPHNLHSGLSGYNKRVWNGKLVNSSYILTYHSKSGDQGFPGDLMITLTYTLINNSLIVEYLGIGKDQETPVNLTNHSYFNLNGHGVGSIADHCLMVNSDCYTPSDSTSLPTGEIRNVVGSSYDLNQGTYLEKRFAKMASEGLKPQFDDNFALNRGEIQARLWSPKSGIEMDMYTSMPGVQVYTANNVGDPEHPVCGKDNKLYYPKSAICLEAQFFPDSVNKPNFPNCMLRVGDIYLQNTKYTFKLKQLMN